MAHQRQTGGDPIKVGVIADQTGPLSFVGARQRQRRPDGHRRHQRQGRPAGAAARAVPRGRRDRRRRRGREGGEAGRAGPGRRHLRRHLQLHAAGHQGPGRRGGQDALHLPRAVRGAGVRPAHLLHRPGAGAAGRPVHPVADARDRGEDVLPAVRRLHLAARAERAGPGGRHGQRRDRSSARSTTRSTTWTTRRRSSGSPRAARTWCSTRSCRPASTPFFEQLHDSGFQRRGGQLVCTYFDENFLNMVPAAHVEGLYSCLDYYQAVERPVQPEAARAVRRALSRATRSSPAAARARACTAGCGSGPPR